MSLTELNELLLPFVDEVNDYIDHLNTLEDKVIPKIIPDELLLLLVQRFVAEHQHSEMSEYLVEVNPYLAIELGLLTRREALREGAIPLTKEDVLNRTISYKELPREAIEALEFAPEEYKILRQ